MAIMNSIPRRTSYAVVSTTVTNTQMVHSCVVPRAKVNFTFPREMPSGISTAAGGDVFLALVEVVGANLHRCCESTAQHDLCVVDGFLRHISLHVQGAMLVVDVRQCVVGKLTVGFSNHNDQLLLFRRGLSRRVPPLLESRLQTIRPLVVADWSPLVAAAKWTEASLLEDNFSVAQGCL